MDDGVVDRLVAYATRKAAHFQGFITVFLQEWYHPLHRKSLGSSWLKDYPCPKTTQRHRLPSNIAAYHSSAELHVDDMDDALVNNPPSDTESGFTTDGGMENGDC